MGIYKPANRGRHSLVDLENFRKFIHVPVRRLDDLVSAAGVTSWAFMKLDVEGYESCVLDGGEETLSRTAMLAMEYLPAFWRKAGIDPKAVLQKLAAYFPRIYRFEGMDLVAMSIGECSRSELTMDLVLRR